MKHILFILLGFIVLFSCQKENDLPDYLPGRLIEVSFESSLHGLIRHEYEYSGDSGVTDKYYYSSPKIFVARYHFSNDHLMKVDYSFENTNEDSYYIQSLAYDYADSQITEFVNDSPFNEYSVKNREIISSSSYNSEPWIFEKNDFEWSVGNLIRYKKQIWFNPTIPSITEFEFEYSELENPYFYSNIPKVMGDFKNPETHDYELSDLVPKCSRNFPSKLKVTHTSVDGKVIVNTYSFECKIFQNVNMPYKVIVTDDETYAGRISEYSLTYEKL